MKSRRIKDKDLIKRHFGSDAKVRGWGGNYRVKTPRGGEVRITPNGIEVIVGGHDIYRACTLLVRDKWGSATIRGSREAMLGAVAHGEVLGVDIRADHRNPRA